MHQADEISYSEDDQEKRPKEIHPIRSAVSSVCVDVIDEGMQPNNYKEGKLQHKIRLVFETAAKRSDGRPFTVSRKFTLSLGETSALRPFLMGWVPLHLWTGKFTTAMVLGRDAVISVSHEPVKGGAPGDVYPKMSAAYPLHVCEHGNCDQPPSKPYTPSVGEHAYKRYVKDESGNNSNTPTLDDGEVPF